MAALSGLIWMVLGIGSAALAAVIRDRVTIDAWMANSGYAILGRLHFPSWRKYAWFNYGKSTRKRLFWEEIREIQSTLKKNSRRRPIILVTSALPHEGKSLLASALAHGLAATGVRTLVIDFNARNTHYARALALNPTKSNNLEDVFAGRLSVPQAAIQVGDKLPLFYIGSQDLDNTPNSRASSAQMRSAFSAMKKAFSVIVIDAPAMESISDALQLAEFADDVILTALAEEDPKHLSGCIDKLKMRSAKLQGIVITERHRAPAECYAKINRYKSDGGDMDIWPVVPQVGSAVAFKLRRIFFNTTKVKEQFSALAKTG